MSEKMLPIEADLTLLRLANADQAAAIPAFSVQFGHHGQGANARRFGRYPGHLGL